MALTVACFSCASRAGGGSAEPGTSHRSARSRPSSEDITVPQSIDLFDALYTTRSLRRFRPDSIPDDVLVSLLDAATRAPNGRNSQDWRFIVVRDPSIRRAVGAIYKEAWDEYSPPSRLEGLTGQARRRVLTAYHLAATMGTEPPVLVVACLDAEIRPGTAPHWEQFVSRTWQATIYPAVQNLLLAARAHGIGGCITTVHLLREEKVKALLGIPDHVHTYAIVPLGYPVDTFGPVTRRPLAEVTFGDRWGEPCAAVPSVPPDR